MRGGLGYNSNMERRTIGILGGTLDPVHLGHLALLRAAREQLGLDEAVLMPAGDPPHKHCHVLAEDRLQMTRLAAAGEFAVSDAEVLRPGRTYTVDTLRRIRAERPDWDIVYAIGSDTLPNLLTWREYPEVFRLCAFATARRPGYADEVPEGARVLWLEGDIPDISSTRIRELAAVRAELSGFVSAPVGRYIRKRGLYLTAMPEVEAERALRETLSPHRFSHTLGVRETAERLANIHGLDAAAARVAGLLHDAAKCALYIEQLRLAEGVADELERANPELLHAPAGMAVARDRFGVRDPEILSAIRNHTLGRRGMSGLELAIYVADFIEPEREDFPGLSDVRELAEADLQAAASKCAELTYDFCRRRGSAPHPRTLELLTKNGR